MRNTIFATLASRLVIIATLFGLVGIACNQKAANVTDDVSSEEVLSLPSTDSVEYTTETLDSIKSQVESGAAILLDVRSQGERDDSHLTISKFIPIAVLSDEAQLTAAIAGLDRGKTVYAHCQRGGRAMTAAKILAKHGFDAKPIQSPYERFAEAGFETEANNE